MEKDITNLNLGKKSSRLGAYLIDGLIIGVPFSLIFTLLIVGSFFYLAATNGTPSSADAMASVIIAVVAIFAFLAIFVCQFIYFGYYLSKKGQTPGMKYIGIKAVKADGNLLTLSEALIRHLTFIFALGFASGFQIIPFIGPLISLAVQFLIWGWCLFDKKQQNIYDKINDVIYVSENENQTRARWAVGLNCGCMLIIFIISVVIGIVAVVNNANNSNKSFGLDSLSMIKKTDSSNLPTSEKPQIEMSKLDSKDIDMINPQFKESYDFLTQLTINPTAFDTAKSNCLKGTRVITGAIKDISPYCTCEAKIIARNNLNKVGNKKGDISDYDATIKYCSIYSVEIAPIDLMPSANVDVSLNDSDVKKYLNTLVSLDSVTNTAFRSCLQTADLRLTNKTTANKNSYCTCESRILTAENIKSEDKPAQLNTYCSTYMK